MRILGAHEGFLDAVVTEDIGAVDKTGHAVACGHIGGGGAHLIGQGNLIGDLGRILAVVALGAGVEAHGGQGLVGILASGNSLSVANGDLAVQIRDVGDGLDLGVGASARMITRSLTNMSSRVSASDELGGLSVIHGALGSGNEHVDGGTGAHLLDKVAGGLKLRVCKRGAGLLCVELLNLGQSLLERVGGKDLQLDSFLEDALAEPASDPAGSDVLLPEQPARPRPAAATAESETNPRRETISNIFNPFGPCARVPHRGL